MNEHSRYTDQVHDWIVGYLTNSLTEEEMRLFQEWLSESVENKRYFSEMQEVWIAACDEFDDDRCFDKDEAYQLFLKRTAETRERTFIRSKSVRLRQWMYAAAMIVIVFICGTVSFHFGKNALRNQLTQVSIEAPYGSKSKLYLPDGTLVWLNAGSKMSYAQDFGVAERELHLTGEAYFEVTKNEHIPFKVHTNELDVKVLGTKFNFRNYQDDLEAKVCLLEGKVSLSVKQKETILQPNQQALLDKKTGRLMISNTEAVHSAEWTNDRLYFDEALLPDIVKELERSYNVKITIADVELFSTRFYGNFRRKEQNIREIMDVLSSTDKMNYTIDGKNIVITLPD